MSPVLQKWQMSEEDIKLHFITPAIKAKWGLDRITMETRITDGRINLRGNFVVRDKPKRADYILYINANNPIAIVEAKDNHHSISHGLQQAMEYARMLDVPFAYSSNGDGFCEHDFLTGQERQLSLEEFPSPDELISRFKQGANAGTGLNDAEQAIIRQPYYSSLTTYPSKVQKEDWQWRTPFKTATVEIAEDLSKEAIFAGLDECLKEIQAFEADLKQKLEA